jgi:hypothetical protein
MSKYALLIDKILQALDQCKSINRAMIPVTIGTTIGSSSVIHYRKMEPLEDNQNKTSSFVYINGKKLIKVREIKNKKDQEACLKGIYLFFSLHYETRSFTNN